MDCLLNPRIELTTETYVDLDNLWIVLDNASDCIIISNQEWVHFPSPNVYKLQPLILSQDCMGVDNISCYGGLSILVPIFLLALLARI